MLFNFSTKIRNFSFSSAHSIRHLRSLLCSIKTDVAPQTEKTSRTLVIRTQTNITTSYTMCIFAGWYYHLNMSIGQEPRSNPVFSYFSHLYISAIMQRIKFTESILIGDSPETVFDFTQDYSKRLQWDTFLIQADLLGGATHADKGVQAYCVSKNRLGMTTEYITFQRPRGTAIKMTQGPFLFKEFLGSWRFRQVAENSTEVTFLYSFTLRFPFTMATYFIRKNLQQNVRQRLVDLKNCIEHDRAQHTAVPA